MHWLRRLCGGLQGGSQNPRQNGALQYDRTACKHCGACAANCFSGALVMSGKEMTVEEVMEEILQDRAYYRNSGGGVTLSGGEVSTQPEFALELLQALKRREFPRRSRRTCMRHGASTKECCPSSIW